MVHPSSETRGRLRRLAMIEMFNIARIKTVMTLLGFEALIN